MVIFCLLRHWVPFAEWWWLWGTSQPRGPGRWMLDQVSAVRASACVFKANVSVINALCYFFSPPHSAFFLLCFAFHLLGWVYWFSVMQTAIKQYSSNAPEPATWMCPKQFKYKPNHQFQLSAGTQCTCDLSAFKPSQNFPVPFAPYQSQPVQSKAYGRAPFLSVFSHLQDTMKKNRARSVTS